MIPYTTPSFQITISGNVDLNNAVDVYVTIVQGTKSVTKTGADVQISNNGATVSIWLTQNESMQFSVGTAYAQVNWTYMDVEAEQIRRLSTEPLPVKVSKQLYKQVIT